MSRPPQIPLASGDESTDEATIGPTARFTADVVEPSEQATRAVIGIVLLLADATRAVSGRFVDADESELSARVAAPSTRSNALAARRIGIGMAFSAQRRLSAATRVVGRVGRPVTSFVVSAPVVRPILDRVGTAVEDLYDAGALEEDRARLTASRATSESVQLAVPVLLEAVDLEPILEAVLDGVDLERLLTHVLDKVEIDSLVSDLLTRVELESILDKILSQVDLNGIVQRVLTELDVGSVIGPVLDQIDLDPVVHQVLDELDLPALVKQVISEVQLSSVMLDATGGITQDALTSVRARSASADALVDRISARVLRRRIESELSPAPVDLDDPADSIAT